MKSAEILFFLIKIWLLLVATLSGPDSYATGSLPGQFQQPVGLSLKALAPQGIVVPKRSALISGLNQQFKSKQVASTNTNNKTTSTTNNSSQAQASQLNQQQQLLTQQQLSPEKLQEITATATSAAATASSVRPMIGGIFPIPSFNWLGARVNSSSQKRLIALPQTAATQAAGPPNANQQQQALYLDRHQQEILAANPSLLNPSGGPQLAQQSAALFTRSEQSSISPALNEPSSMLSTSALQKQQQQQQDNIQQQQQQLYRGFSLIELEVRTDSDRRYVQDLYANLTAAINEQAKNPQGALTVSPYVDVDFWSFKYALNDQIDIMVSPKSRSFILGQLNRAKIRHRIKIDDIQARLDTQLPAGSSSSSNQVVSSGSLDAMSKSSDSNGNAGLSLSGRQSMQTTTTTSSGVGSGSSQQLTSKQGTNNNDDSLSTAQQNRKPMNDSTFFENYQRLADINQYLESILDKNRDVAQVKVIGRSSQGRYLRVLKLGYDQTEVDGTSKRAAASDQERVAGSQQQQGSTGRQPINQNNASYIMESFFRKQEAVQKVGSIWLDGGTHAREWISPATSLYIAFRLSDNHYRCKKFFETLRMVVAQSVQMNTMDLTDATAASSKLSDLELSDRTFFETERQARRYGNVGGYNRNTNNAAPLTVGGPDADLLLPGINEINSSLLGGKPLKQTRPRTELEHTMELLAKSPQEVASEYGCDLELEQLLRRYTFYIMPVLNPDGYEYSHTHNRLWRKTRSTSNHPIYRHFCLGADPNRNYDARHGSTGSSTHPCSQTYAGTVPFTEPETRHQSNFVYSQRHQMKMFISFHSYSQMILLPYSHSTQLPPDHKDLDSVGQAAVKAIEKTHGTLYRVGPSASILYTASGTASDWAYEKAGIKYSYTIELRDTGTYGFLLPRQQIIPTGEETFNGLLAMINQMEKNERLLTSKSSVVNSMSVLNGASLNRNSQSLSSSSAQPSNHEDLNHVPDLENLNVQTRFKNQRPPLENILDNASGDSPTGAGPVQGVRDRRPANEIKANDDLNDATTTTNPYHNSYKGNSPYEPEAAQTAGLQRFFTGSEENENEVHTDDTEPDSGYAFEGEGELMEPTSSNILESIRLAKERGLMEGRHQHHSRRIVQSAGLTASGRNLINSPLLTSRTTVPVAPKRESSDDLVERRLP